MCWSFPYLEGYFVFFRFWVLQLATLLAMSYEFADILTHGWPEVFGRYAFVSSQFSGMPCEGGSMVIM